MSVKTYSIIYHHKALATLKHREVSWKVRRNRKKERTDIKCLKRSCFSVVTLEAEDNEGFHITSYSTMKKEMTQFPKKSYYTYSPPCHLPWNFFKVYS